MKTSSFRLSVIYVPLTLFAFVISFLSATRQEISPPPPSAQHASHSGAMEALEFWTAARAYPFSDIPSGSYTRAFASSRRRMKDLRSPYSPPEWKFLGPTNLAGRMIAVAINPQNPNTIYAGSASGGLWRSHTGGIEGDWHRIQTSGHPVLGVNAIAIDPVDTTVLYIGTGEVYRYQGSVGGIGPVRTTRGSYGVGILKSTNAGETWSPSLDWSLHEQRGVQRLKFNPLNHTTLWAATTEGLFKSTDAGATWEGQLLSLFATDVILHSTDSNKIMASFGNLGYAPAVFRTLDGGQSWDLMPFPTYSGKTMLESNYSYPDIVFASVADSTTGVGTLYTSSDFGNSWTILKEYTTTGQLLGVQGWYSHFVASRPDNPAVIVHNGVNDSHSDDGGATFSSAAGGYSDNHAYDYLPSQPDILYIANDNGIYRSTDFGASYTHVSEGLATGQFYNGFSNSSTDSLLAIVQSQDHIPGYIYRGALGWGRSAVDESGWTAIHPTNDSVMFAVNRFGGSITRSLNRGTSFTTVGSGFAGIGCWNSPIVISPSNPSVMYFGKSRIYKSTAGGTGWSSTNGGAELDGNPVLSLAVSANDPNVVYAGTLPHITRAHIFRTTNGGTSWQDVTATLPDRYPMDIAVDPSNSQTAYVVFGGFGTGHVFKTTTGGDSWTDITGVLPDVPTTALAIDPLETGNVYVGNDISVYVSTDAGTSWNAFGDGLSDAMIISDLTISPANRALRASTHGNGAFERQLLSSPSPSLSILSPNGSESIEAGAYSTISWSQHGIMALMLEFSIDGGSTWELLADSVPSFPNRFSWLVPSISTDEAKVRLTSLTDSAYRVESAAPFSIFFNGILVSALDGWNLLSMPLSGTPRDVALAYSGALSDAISFAGEYVERDSVSTGMGYWIKLPGAAVVALRGERIVSDTISVVPGWNLVGSIGFSLPVEQIASDPPSMTTSEFYGYERSYRASATIEPGKGYWVKVSESGSLILSASPTHSPSHRIRIIPIAELPPQLPGSHVAESEFSVPATHSLRQNYPNPFNPSTAISFDLAHKAFVTLTLYDVTGKEIDVLARGDFDRGTHTIDWDGSDRPSGVYFCTFRSGSTTETKRIVLLR